MLHMYRLSAIVCLWVFCGCTVALAGDKTVRTMPGQHRVHLNTGRVLEGTILFSGIRGMVLATKDRDVFVPRTHIVRTEAVKPAETAPTPVALEVGGIDVIKTFEVTERNGTYVLRHQGGEVQEEVETQEEKPAPERNPFAQAVKPAPAGVAAADKALSAGTELAIKGREAKTAKESNAFYEKALPLLKQAEKLYQAALKQDQGNKEIERKLQEAMKQRYWCEKMTRVGMDKRGPRPPSRRTRQRKP